MKTSVYEYRNYKRFLLDWIEDNPDGTRGQRKALADAIGCQVSHITNVFSGHAHFSPEQAEACARHVGLNTEETDYLLHLIQFDRSGTSTLRKLYEKLLDEKQKQANSLKARLKMPESLSKQDESQYYSNWYFGAVHVLLSIPEFQTREALCKKLHLSIEKIDQILEFLAKSGLCEKVGSKYQITKKQVHLDRASPLIARHHTNWRLKTLQSLEQIAESDLHYSAIVTLSDEDFQVVTGILKKSLSESLKVITNSSEKEAAIICIDLFKL